MMHAEMRTANIHIKRVHCFAVCPMSTITQYKHYLLNYVLKCKLHSILRQSDERCGLYDADNHACYSLQTATLVLE